MKTHTTLDLDRELVAAAAEALGTTRTTDTVHAALREAAARKHARMRRTTISLPDDVATALEREARRRRVPVSQVAREAIEARLGWVSETGRTISFIGIANSKDATWPAATVEEFLAQTWTDEIERDAFNRDR